MWVQAGGSFVNADSVHIKQDETSLRINPRNSAKPSFLNGGRGGRDDTEITLDPSDNCAVKVQLCPSHGRITMVIMASWSAS